MSQGRLRYYQRIGLEDHWHICQGYGKKLVNDTWHLRLRKGSEYGGPPGRPGGSAQRYKPPMIEPHRPNTAGALMDPHVLGDCLTRLGPEGPRLLRGIVEAFLHETPPMVEDMGEALGRGDRAGVAWLARKLRGSCMSIGASQLAARCVTLEETCHEGQLPPPAAYAGILADFIATRGSLKSFVKEIL